VADIPKPEFVGHFFDGAVLKLKEMLLGLIHKGAVVVEPRIQSRRVLEERDEP
jgi:hypothetical protein